MSMKVLRKFLRSSWIPLQIAWVHLDKSFIGLLVLNRKVS